MNGSLKVKLTTLMTLLYIRNLLPVLTRNDTQKLVWLLLWETATECKLCALTFIHSGDYKSAFPMLLGLFVVNFSWSCRVGARLGFKSFWSMISLIFVIKNLAEIGWIGWGICSKIQRMARYQSVVDKPERCEICSKIQHLLLNDTFPCELSTSGIKGS